MKALSARFQTSAPDLASCPESSLPEFAFIGRSNVGKSSLLNMLVGAKALARVSSSPGHTRLINSYAIDNAWGLVDLPGYGYAKTSKADRERFAHLIATYLSGRENLAWIFVLIDARHPPQKIDLEFVTWLAEGTVPFALVFNKSDLVKPGALHRNSTLFLAALAESGMAPPPVLSASAKTRSGRPELLRFISEALGRER